jgi:ribonucleoside-diphosphate reductase beta chain
MFGVAIIKHIQKEQPDWFGEEFFLKIERASRKAFEAESAIIDWIFKDGELSFLSKETIKEFIKQRFNESLEMVGAKPLFEVNKDLVKQLKWFDDEIYAEVNTDFFHKKPVTYSKKTQSITAEDIF